MTYHGIPGDRKNLGIKPTLEDKKFVSNMTLLNIGVREICIALGERFHLGKPMSRQTVYWHFRKQLGTRKKGRIRVTKLTNAQVDSILGDMNILIEEISGGKKKAK